MFSHNLYTVCNYIETQGKIKTSKRVCDISILSQNHYVFIQILHAVCTKPFQKKPSLYPEISTATIQTETFGSKTFISIKSSDLLPLCK